jgi:hypothetical protein
MKKLLLAAVAMALIAFFPTRADAKVAAVYASGMGGLQNSGESSPGLGLMLGARVLIFDGYLDYTGFGAGESVSRGILGLRGGFGSKELRLVLRGGFGGIHEENGALTGPAGAPSRTGGVVRAGAALEAAINPLTYVGFGFDAERYQFPANNLGIATGGTDIFASLRLTFELGI